MARVLCVLALLSACQPLHPTSTFEPAAASTSGSDAGPGASGSVTSAGSDPTEATTGVVDPAGSSQAGTTGDDDATRMSRYGAACSVDADCVALLSADAVCLKDLLGVYALPGGYCTTLCALPADGMTTVVEHAPDCLLGGDCFGLDGYLAVCAPACSDDSQCPRDGYACRRMPQLSQETDPTYCLMTDEHML